MKVDDEHREQNKTEDERHLEAGPQGVCWEYQAGEAPIRLSFTIKVF